MKIEVVSRVWYTVELSDDDMEKVMLYIKTHKKELRYCAAERAICKAVAQLSSDCEIELFDGSKETESDFLTEEINWSEHEERTAEEILNEWPGQ